MKVLILTLFALAPVCFSAPPAPPPGSADGDFAALTAVARERAPEGLTPEAREEWRILHGARYNRAALQFYKDYPNDPRRWEAGMDHYAMRNVMFAGGNELVQARKILGEVLAAPSIDDKWWQQAKWLQVQDMLSSVNRLQNDLQVKTDLTGVRRHIDELARRSPQDSSLAGLEMRYVGLLKQQDARAAEAWMVLMAQSENKRVAQVMSGRLRIERMKQEPVELKFAALDGREVDLTQLRGKVVLIDFWATWCGPCLAELPNLRKVYQTYRSKGFEIVGVSLDGVEDRQKLIDFLQKENMSWPQHFDGKRWQSELAVLYGINSVPTQLLLDQKGLLVSDEARGAKLEADVRRLLGS